MNNKKRSFSVFTLLLLVIAGNLHSTIQVKTAWAEYQCDDQLFETVIDLPVIQRMKDIAVAGPTYYVGMVPAYSRFDHSVGVWWLLRSKAQADTKEQLAGLLHDASHTVFSHVGDTVFGAGDGDKSYQDTIHLWFLDHYKDLRSVIDEQNITLEQLDPDHPDYRALEQHLPDLCADRIEYNIHTGVVFGRITKEEASALVDALEYQNGFWFFTDTAKAKQFAQLPLYFTKHVWGGHENIFVNHCFGQAIKHALKTGLLSYEIMHFGSDTQVVKMLTETHDPVIKTWIEKAYNYQDQYAVVGYGEGTLNSKPKCRAVDPYVRCADGSFARLSQLDADFAQELHALQAWCAAGYGIVFPL